MVNIRKIAKQGNVSIATVSRVLNNSPLVKEETREKVKRLIEKYGYLPNPLAQGLVQKKTWLIGVIVPDMFNQFIPTVVEPFTQILAKAKYQCVLNLTGNDPQKEERAINEILRYYREALLFVGTRNVNDPNRELIEKTGEKIPIIMVNALEKYQNTIHIYNNECKAIENVVDYVINHNRERLALVIGSINQNTFIHKKNGFINGLRKNNIDIDKCHILEGYSGYEAGNEAVKILMELKDLPNAIITGSDIIALGILQYLMVNSIKVPDDIMLIGYDNIPFAEISFPGLTTVDQMGDRLGKKAAELLLKILHSKEEHNDICYIPRLHIRETA